MQQSNRGIVFLLYAAAMLTAAHDEAAQALERVLEVEPDHARAHYLLGTALFNTGQTELAADHLRRFVELAPDDPDVAIAGELLAYLK